MKVFLLCLFAIQDMRSNVTDFILGVEDSRAWHEANLRRHPAHYSGLARLAGPGGVAWAQVWRPLIGRQQVT